MPAEAVASAGGDQPPSVRRLLGRAQRQGLSLEVQLLLGRAVGRERSWVLAHPEHRLTEAQWAAYQPDLARLQSGVPLPYLLGEWEFYGRPFSVGPEALIPRPETELLVDLALELAPHATRVLDLGTGSGCVAVTLACELPVARILASDRSVAALRLAQENAERHAVDNRVRLAAGDLLGPFAGQFDLVCANLPYLSTGRLARLPVARREPKLALDGGRDGLRLIHRALRDLPGRLAPGGVALFELDPEQAEPVVRLARGLFRDGSVAAARDLAGRRRVVLIRRG